MCVGQERKYLHPKIPVFYQKSLCLQGSFAKEPRAFRMLVRGDRIYVCVYMNVYICMYSYGGEGLRGLRESHTYVNICIHTIYIYTHLHIIVHTHMNVHIWRGETQGTERKQSKSFKT